MGKHWTSNEEDRLCDLFKLGYTSRRIAQLMGRTRGAIEKRYYDVLGNSKKKLFSQKLAETSRKFRIDKESTETQ